MIRCLDKCEKQWRSKQTKPGWQKEKKKEQKKREDIEKKKRM